ncbi:hypothetical protein HDG35_005173 [Paraburkholderia sp. JPY681]|nr:hypothetical protein [Paraburkholderia atlantica]
MFWQPPKKNDAVRETAMAVPRTAFEKCIIVDSSSIQKDQFTQLPLVGCVAGAW